MHSVKEIEKAVESLPETELKNFRAWFAEFDAEIWDSEIKEHALCGKLDQLGKAALRSHRNKDTKEI